MTSLDFYRKKRVLVTGHTGFKGAWLCQLLLLAGADVTGFALPPEEESLFRALGLEHNMRSVYGDVRDGAGLLDAMGRARPELVFHLAAQPLVREAYRAPAHTYAVNVMGTVNLLEAVRLLDCVRSAVIVTTDKVYENREWPWGYRENDALDGRDPYSNSKSCAELATGSYVRSFLRPKGVPVSTARAGNVIGGGDFAKDRILPDCIRAVRRGAPVVLRSPASVRPYQHVLEPLSAYLRIARAQWEDGEKAGAYNVGPDAGDCVTTARLAELFCRAWGGGARWEARPDGGPHESGLLSLDCARIRLALGWRPRWDVETAVEKTVAWTKAYLSGGDIPEITRRQIEAYFSEETDGGVHEGS